MNDSFPKKDAGMNSDDDIDALLDRLRDASEAELAEGQADHDIFVGLDARYAESCPDAALWEPIVR